MAEKLTIKISTAAASFLRQDTPREMKLQAARGDVAVSDRDLATLLFYLAHDQDPAIRETAVASLRALSEPQLLAIVASPDLHPKILEALARLHYANRAVTAGLLAHPATEERTRAFLAAKQAEKGSETLHEPVPEPAAKEEETEAGATEEVAEVDEESEGFKSKFKLSLTMEVPEKIKMALIGDKEWRTLLLKDSNKLVSVSVLKNPRLTEPEILALVNSTAANEEMLRIVCGNKDWLKNYQIRKALVLNCKTPLPTALRFLATLTEKDLAMMAKSKNISSIISTQARKQVLNKKR